MCDGPGGVVVGLLYRPFTSRLSVGPFETSAS